MEYHPTNYRSNIVKYWRQWYPQYTIPKGHHVHHIIPRCICKQNGWSDDQINHPRNLIVVDPVTHADLHKCRGDNVTDGFIYVIGRIQTQEIREKISSSSKGRKVSEVTLKRRSASLKGKKRSVKTKELLRCIQTGKKASNATRLKMSKSQRGNIKHIGANSSMFEGYFITPWGTFDSSNLALDMCPVKSTAKSIIKYCKECDSVVTKHSLVRSKVLQMFGEESIGKTFKSLGFGFDKVAWC